MSESNESSPSNPVTECLERIRDGHPSAAANLMPLVYEELRNLARFHVARPAPDQTIQATALVHEAYLRLVKNQDITWESRAHFFAVAAMAMRQILANHVRDKRAAKRKSDGMQVSLSQAIESGGSTEFDMVALNDALQVLSELDERQGNVVSLRFFSGMEFDEIALVLKVSTRTVERDWRMARAWLSAELRSDGRA